MSGSEVPPSRKGPPPPALPEVDTPSTDDVLAGVPSPEEIVKDAASAREVLEEQPSVDELLGPDR
jgi:hypothetical protein